MDITSLYYFTEIAKDLHITQTADRLYISQQTLSNHLLRLEEYFGTQLVTRKPSLSLTFAGKQVLAFVKNLQKEETNLKSIIVDINQEQRGILRFGASAMRMNACIPYVLPLFSAKYPEVDLRLTDTVSSQLEPMVDSGDLDFAIVLTTVKNPRLERHHLMYDQVYLCVADELLNQYYGKKADAIRDKSRDGADLRNFSKLPFCIFSNRMGLLIKDCFDEVSINPKRYIVTSSTQIGITVCYKRLAASFASKMNFINQQGSTPDDINIFPLKSKSGFITQELTLIYRKDRYQLQYSRFFMNSLMKHFSELEQFHVGPG